jgi:hypothetical protein
MHRLTTAQASDIALGHWQRTKDLDHANPDTGRAEQLGPRAREQGTNAYTVGPYRTRYLSDPQKRPVVRSRGLAGYLAWGTYPRGPIYKRFWRWFERRYAECPHNGLGVASGAFGNGTAPCTVQASALRPASGAQKSFPVMPKVIFGSKLFGFEP